MQKSGNKQEDIHPPVQLAHSEFHRASLRTKISNYFVKKKGVATGEVKLPTEGELEGSIDSLFRFSENKQPSKRLNSGAGIADATSLYIMAFNHPVAVLGLAASEGISFAKNYLDSRHYSELVNSEREFLEKYKSDIISTLESKLPIAGNKKQETELKNLISETESFFSEVDARSKQHLDSALKRRLQGIGSSVGALIVNSTILKPLVDYTSNFFQSLAHVQLVQPPGYNPDPAMALIDLAVRVTWLLASSSLILMAGYEARKDSPKPLQRRNDARYELEERAGKLLERIHEIID
jgi:hypothetical protein